MRVRLVMLKVLLPGMQTLVEDWIGREGYLDKGIAPSGAMDHLAVRAANLIVANSLNEAVIEITAGSFSAKFETDAVIAVTGANLGPRINGKLIPLWQAIKISKGDIFTSGTSGKDSLGFRQYLAIAGGIDVPIYLGSKSTAIYGAFGGYEGRALKRGDELKLSKSGKDLKDMEGRRFKADLIPKYSKRWEMRAIPGPNAAPDYFSEEGMELFFTEEFDTQVFSDRSGIRLTGPSPGWAKARQASGRHPSNVLMDHGYSTPGGVNVSGDTPIIFPREGPTTGGYVCALTVIYTDQWMLGQIFLGRDTVRFVYCMPDEAVEIRKEQDKIFEEKSIIR